MTREECIDGLQELCEYLFHEYKVCYKGDEEDTYNRFLAANNALNLLKSQPEQKFFVDSDGKITPLPMQKHGRWIDREFGEWKCSACNNSWYLEVGDPEDNEMNYCPICGAKMDE